MTDPYFPGSTPDPPATITPHIAGETYDEYVARAAEAVVVPLSQAEWANALQTVS